MRGQFPKAYLRLDPNLDQTHPDPGAFVRLLCAAARQPKRGLFKTWALLENALGRAAAKKHRDVWRDISESGSEAWMVVGWDDWQEGDLTVQERMRRYRDRHSAVTSGVTTTVTTPSPNRHLTKPPLSPTPPNTPGFGQQAPGNGAATAEEGTLRGPFLTVDARSKLVADGSDYIRRLAVGARDPGEVLRHHSLLKGGFYLVRLDTAKDEHLIRTVNSMRDEVQGLDREAKGERGGLLTSEEQERRRQERWAQKP